MLSNNVDTAYGNVIVLCSDKLNQLCPLINTIQDET